MFGHPKGLAVLFFTEMWERFSYYGMRAILVLYLVSQTSEGGLGWTKLEALELYGWYTMLVYLMGIPGGYIADRYLGQRAAVFLGGFLLVAGHSLMAYSANWAFYSALGLIVIGVGFLKPNISSMVGELYPKGDPRKDAGFTIFYIGINIGAVAAALLVGYVGENIGWHYGFGLAGIGMTLGQIQYWLGRKHLKDVGLSPKHRIAELDTIDTHTPLSRVEKDRVLVLLISFLLVIVFWAAFEQAGGLMNLYTFDYTDRNLLGWEVPASWFQSLNPLFIILFGGVIASLWAFLGKRKREPSNIFKMGLGSAVLGLGFLFMLGAVMQRSSSELGLSAMHWLVFAYLFHTLGELCLSPIALSFVTKMAPRRISSLMMGVYFAASGLGNKLAASLGALSDSYGEGAVFGGLAVATISMGTLIMLLSKKLSRLAHE